MIHSQYDQRIRELETELRLLRRKRKDELRGAEPKVRRPMRRAPKDRVPAEVRAYWSQLCAMGCIVTGRTGAVTIHHCHGGSMIERGVRRVAGKKTSDWLVIPLDITLHSLGPDAIDGAVNGGVLSWEAKYGRQADFIDKLVARTGVDVWAKAREKQ